MSVITLTVYGFIFTSIFALCSMGKEVLGHIGFHVAAPQVSTSKNSVVLITYNIFMIKTWCKNCVSVVSEMML